MSIKDAVMKALDKIGNTNGHSAPQSQDQIVAVIHDYHVATIGESYFKARRDKAKKLLEKSIGVDTSDKLTKEIASVKRNQQGSTVEAFTTDPYSVQIELKNGASYLDVAKLKVTLARKFKLTTDQIEELIEESTDRRDPSQSWKVTER